MRSVLRRAHYPPFEVIVVDDHSTDGTGDIARAIAAADSRLRVVTRPTLPAGWFGKQWACATGAAAAHGDDPPLYRRRHARTRRTSSRARERDARTRRRPADRRRHQEMSSFWERVIQPQIFALLSLRYGGTEHVSNAQRAADVIANGQFILVRRDAYDAVGGHAAVRDAWPRTWRWRRNFVAPGGGW